MSTAVLNHWSNVIRDVDDHWATLRLLKSLNDAPETIWHESPNTNWGWVIDKLLEIRSLKADWDGFGAKAVDPELVDTVMRLVLSLQRHDSPVPTHVSPHPDGIITIEWQGNGGSVIAELEIE